MRCFAVSDGLSTIHPGQRIPAIEDVAAFYEWEYFFKVEGEEFLPFRISKWVAISIRCTILGDICALALIRRPIGRNCEVSREKVFIAIAIIVLTFIIGIGSAHIRVLQVSIFPFSVAHILSCCTFPVLVQGTSDALAAIFCVFSIFEDVSAFAAFTPAKIHTKFFDWAFIIAVANFIAGQWNPTKILIYIVRLVFLVFCADETCGTIFGRLARPTFIDTFAAIVVAIIAGALIVISALSRRQKLSSFPTINICAITPKVTRCHIKRVFSHLGKLKGPIRFKSICFVAAEFV